MSKYRELLENAQLPQDFLDAFQEFIGTYVSPNFTVVVTDKANPTTLRIPAGSDNEQVGIAINGRWRYITANADFAAPGAGVLTVGENPIFVAASANAFSINPTPPPSEIDSTDYGFRLLVKAPGDTPSGTGTEALYRQVGTVLWDGSHFTDVKLSVGTGPRLHTPWSVSIHKTTTPSIPSGVETTIQWEIVENRDDNLGFMPIVTDGVEITDPGTYLISALTEMAGADSSVLVYVVTGGVGGLIASGRSEPVMGVASATAPVVNCAAGQIVKTTIFQASGSAKTLANARVALVRLH